MKGRDIGEPCPGCQTGHLRPVLELPRPQGERPAVVHGAVGSIRTVRSIDHLACDACFSLFQSKDRGRDIVAAIGPMTEAFHNPPKEPIVCTCCMRKLTVGGYVPLSLRRQLNLEPEDDPGPTVAYDYQRLFLFCEQTGTIFWVTPAKKEQP